jgi:hypothetical protein
MDPQILHTTLIQDRPVDPAGEPFAVNLPVNPLTAIIITLRALNAGAVQSITAVIADFLAKYSSFSVKYRGATQIEGQAEDLAVAMMLRERQAPSQGQMNRTDNDVRSLTFALTFGRRMYDPIECFPATRSGDLVFGFVAEADAGGLDGHSIQVETIELLDARPERYLKVTTTEQAMVAAGENKIDLPIGNKLLGVLLRPFTFPTGASFNSSFGELALKVDNVEVMEASRNWESMHGMLARRIPPWWTDLDHIHGFADAAAGQTDTQGATRDTALAQAYAYLDWDPLNDGRYLLDTRGAATLRLHINSDVADAANTSRVLPIELVELQRPGSSS